MNFRVRLKRTIVNLQMQSRYIKASIVIGVDLILLVSLVFVAYALRVSSLSLLPWSALPLSLLGPILSIASAAIFGAYGAVTRTYSKDTEYRIMLSQFAVLPVWMLISFLIFEDGFSRDPNTHFGLAVPSLGKNNWHFREQESGAIRPPLAVMFPEFSRL